MALKELYLKYMGFMALSAKKVPTPGLSDIFGNLTQSSNVNRNEM